MGNEILRLGTQDCQMAYYIKAENIIKTHILWGMTVVSVIDLFACELTFCFLHFCTDETVFCQTFKIFAVFFDFEIAYSLIWL